MAGEPKLEVTSIATRRPALAIALLLALSLGLQLASLRDEMPWGDDYAMYVMHARNLAEGRPYGDTGYIVDPDEAQVGPAAYPPGFPLLLTPVYKLRGLDLHALKLEQIGLLVLALVVVAGVLSAELPRGPALVALAALAANPCLVRLPNVLTSDVVFLLFTSLSLLLARRLEHERAVALRVSPDIGPARPWLWSALLGFTVYVTVSCRSIGAVWFLVLPVCDLVRMRRLRSTTLFALLAAAMFLVTQLRFVSAGETSYFHQFKRDFSYILPNAREYVASLTQFWPSGLTLLDRGLLALLGALALAGFASRVRSGPGLLEIYTAGYLATVLVWPAVQAPRFLVPMLPSFAIYVALGVELASRRLGRRAKVLAVAVPALLLVAYTGAYVRARPAPADSARYQATLELVSFIGQQTPRQAVVIFEKPRTIALYTGRRSSTYHEALSDDDLWKYFAKVGATHLVVNRGVPPGTKGEEDAAHSLYIQHFAERQAARLSLVFENAAYRAFALR